MCVLLDPVFYPSIMERISEKLHQCPYQNPDSSPSPFQPSSLESSPRKDMIKMGWRFSPLAHRTYCVSLFKALYLFLILFTSSIGLSRAHEVAPLPKKSVNICSAVIDVVYKTDTGKLAFDGKVDGRYALTSKVEAEQGKVVHLVTEMGNNDGCTPAVNTPQTGRWIALVQRGNCKFADKIHNAALLSNASAVVVYNNKEEDDLITMHHNGESSFLLQG